MALASDNKIGLEPGFVVDGRYRVVRVIDLGGTGVVHHVEHVQTGRNLALKTLLDPSNEGRLEQEARAASHLRNAHAVRVVDMGRAADVGSYIVMELLEGTNLRSLLDDAGQLPIEVAASIALQICECLDEAHAGGIIHRDLKPGNIHLTPTFESRYHVTVLDFGAVKLQGPAIGSSLSPNEELTRVGSTVGTPFYMSLEQLRGNASVDAVSDVYSLSVVLYEMLAGTRPFQADTIGDLVYALVQTKPSPLSGVRPDVPPELAQIVMRGLSPRREERPQTARDVARVLASLSDPSASMWMRSPPASRQATGAMPAATGNTAPQPGRGAPLPPPTPSRPGHGVAGHGATTSAPDVSSHTRAVATAPAPIGSLGAPRPLGAPALQPPPRTAAPGSDRGAPALRPPVGPGSAGALGAPLLFDHAKSSSTSSEHSALTFIPSHNVPAMQEQPTSALPIADAHEHGILPDLDLQLTAPAGHPAPPPKSGRRPLPPAIKRQDTPTEMYAQDVHDAAVPSLELDLDGPPGRGAPRAPARPAPPSHPPGAPSLPSSSSDDDSTSVLDLDALKAASAAKAAAAKAGKTTPPPPSFGPRPTPASAQLSEVPPGTLPAGATETMRLDVESPSGPMPLQRLFPGPLGADGVGLEGVALDLGHLPTPSGPTDPGPARDAPTFDPSHISLADARPSAPSPASPRAPAAMAPSGAQLPYATAPSSAQPTPPSAVPISGPTVPEAPRTKPAWQGAVDQGMISVSRSTTEAISRFFVWFRKLNTGEQTTFIVCTVLGFLIALMLAAYVVIY